MVTILWFKVLHTNIIVDETDLTFKCEIFNDYIGKETFLGFIVNFCIIIFYLFFILHIIYLFLIFILFFQHIYNLLCINYYNLFFLNFTILGSLLNVCMYIGDIEI